MLIIAPELNIAVPVTFKLPTILVLSKILKAPEALILIFAPVKLNHEEYQN